MVYSLLVAGKDFIYLHSGFSSVKNASNDLERLVSCLSKEGVAKVLHKGEVVKEITFEYR